MMHAYDEALFEEAGMGLGLMLDFAVHSLHMDADNMLALFAASHTSELFEKGDIRTIMGMSGIELAYDVLERCGISYKRTSARRTKSLSAEYHLGRCLAELQYKTALSFSEILRGFSCKDFLSDHSSSRTEYLSSLPMDLDSEERIRLILQFDREFASKSASAYINDILIKEQSPNPGALLKAVRIKMGLSQSALSKASGVPLRTLQQYEQGQKDIRKARATYIVALAKALNTDPSKLIHHFSCE